MWRKSGKNCYNLNGVYNVQRKREGQNLRKGEKLSMAKA